MRARLRDLEFAAGQAAQFGEMRAATHRAGRDRARWIACRSRRNSAREAWPSRPSIGEHGQLVDVHGRRRQLDGDILARQFVCAAAIDLFRGYGRRGLQDLAAEAIEQRRSSSAASIDDFALFADGFARAIVGRRGPAEADRCLRRFCRCACRTAPGAWRGRPPAAARRWRWDRACRDGRPSSFARCGAFCRLRRARSSPRACRLR